MTNNELKEKIEKVAKFKAQYVKLGYSEKESEMYLEMYVSELKNLLTDPQLDLYIKILDSEIYNEFIATGAAQAVGLAYERFFEKAVTMSLKEQTMKFDA